MVLFSKSKPGSRAKNPALEAAAGPKSASPLKPAAASTIALPTNTASLATTNQSPLPPSKPVVRPEARWAGPVEERAFAAFKDWVKRNAAATGAERAAMEDEGVRLATKRRSELTKLIQADPQRALALAVPDFVRTEMPAAVAALLETPISGRGDLTVMAAFPEPGQPAVRPANSRYATLDGQTYNAYVFGRRLGHPTRWNLPLNGIAIGSNAALDDSPVRVLSAAEAARAKVGLPADPVCSISGLASTANHEEVALDTGGTIAFLCSADHAARLAASLAAAEDALPPGAAYGKGGTVESLYANTGERKILLIRVDFDDYTTDPFTDTEGTNVITALNTSFSNWSCGRMTVALTGAGSDVTPVFRMPRSNASYNGDDNALRTDARNAATTNGYVLTDYDLDAVCFGGGASGWGYGGLAYVGARGVWLHTTGQSSTANIATHEFGHNFGLNHANFYNAPFGTVIYPGGSNDEYGNPWDTMGSASTANTYGASQKKYLGWITNGSDGNEWVGVSSGTTTNRLYAHDEAPAIGVLKGVRVTRDASLNNDKEYFWLEYRTSKSSKPLDNGVVVNWAGSGNEKPELLDTTPGSDPSSTNDKDDSPLIIGRTFTDTNYNIHITPIGKGSGTPGWIDVVVRYGAFAGNADPIVDVAASATNAATGVSLTFTATASDPDGDALAYSWTFDDTDYSTSNSNVVTHSWSSSGEYRVQCTVSDLKGGSASASITVRIGSPTVYTIAGQVLLHGLPQPGVRVYTDATNFCYSDSDGFYNLVGLKAGGYSVSAFQESHAFVRSGFSNPLTVGPNTNNINFAGGIPLSGGLVSRTMNMSTTNTPMLFWVFDWETAHTNLTVDFVSGNTNVIPDSGLTFSISGTNRTLTVKPAAGMSGVVTNLLVTTDPDGASLTNTFTISVQPPPALTTATNTANEDTAINVDLWARTSDASPSGTADSNVLYTVTVASNGTAVLLTNRTVQFTPATNFNGPTTFTFTARDKGFHPALLLYYDFEPSDTTSDAKSSDRSGNGRDGTLDKDGTGAYAYVTNDAPPDLAPFSLVALQLTDNGTSNSARLYRKMLTTEYNLNNADWTFVCWFRRDSSTNDDFLFYDGPSDGNGSGDEELQLYLPSGNNRARVRLYNVTNGIDMELNGPTTALTGEWHHVALTYDRTNSNKGNFNLWFDGVLAATSNGITVNIAQTNLVFGGHDGTNGTQRWLDGALDEVALFKVPLSSNDIVYLQTHTVAHLGGLTSTTNVTLNFTPVNDPPVLTSISNRTVNPGVIIAFTNTATDPEVPASQALTYSLLTFPTGATLNATSGVFNWRAPIAQAGTTNVISVKVADNGSPLLSATQQFTVFVGALTNPPQPTAVVMSNGQWRFTVTGQVGPDYIVQATTNMTAWSNLLVTNPAALPFTWTDSNSSAYGHRFYRVLLGP
ncbi:MAG: PKD domain-containing protein [Verrucomicrobia bacterium]|nr:PKD domain-containing protein [Verrucomicrobiota bacterium]